MTDEEAETLRALAVENEVARRTVDDMIERELSKLSPNIINMSWKGFKWLR